MSKLNELEELEKQARGATGVKETVEIKNEVSEVKEVKQNETSIIDGYKIVDKSILSNNGKLYPENWQILYRCPTAIEVANFSTVNENDQPAVFAAVEDLITRCVMIYDTEKEDYVSSKELNDGDRLMFMLLIREYYLPDYFISYNTMCPYCKENVEVRLVPSALRYKKITDKMMSFYNGRVFTIPKEELGVSEDIVFHIPTLKISGKIFQYLLKSYRGEQQDKEAFMKQFLLVAPFLFETGTETLEAIKIKFKKIQMNGALFDAYVNIANMMKFDNLEKIVYSHDCGSEEEAEIRFPGGWKNFFVNRSKYQSLFGE